MPKRAGTCPKSCRLKLTRASAAPLMVASMPTRGCGALPRRFARIPTPRSDGRRTPGVRKTGGPSICSSCDASGSWSHSRNPPLPACARALLHSLFGTSFDLDVDAAWWPVAVSDAARRSSSAWPRSPGERLIDRAGDGGKAEGNLRGLTLLAP